MSLYYILLTFSHILIIITLSLQYHYIFILLTFYYFYFAPKTIYFWVHIFYLIIVSPLLTLFNIYFEGQFEAHEAQYEAQYDTLYFYLPLFVLFIPYCYMNFEGNYICY